MTALLVYTRDNRWDTFKSTFQILDELSTKWSSLTDIQQANGLPGHTEMYVVKHI